jgi:hypothetical protein
MVEFKRVQSMRTALMRYVAVGALWVQAFWVYVVSP